ncbi:hypothetical protein LTS08_006494 [Lithohypha guttulata]|uniref:Zinc finger protein 207 n=1 Tax=Lithohypha guttulata TaxID=1690604 RepID=A0AAN7T0Y6_9EURO|nr:hypothetical protein LTR51_000734 [Lithohypha guttulata]KAK5085918.1 hypothetical protein LTR05_005208 [Lithohypha guttulata]KAK5098361.1 hypothetical protein LTS08_006494 [Lithohypha guttulata]
MTKKKRGHPDVEEVLSRPWCYYCERDFDDLKILINHQKAKHFKCDRCGRRLNTAGGLNVHMNQVHKETLTAIENALPNRSGLDVEIFGMEGIPDEIVQQHNQRVLTQFHQVEAERRAATGNPAPGAQSTNAIKKPKFESPSDLKKRLAEHKAAKLAAEQNGGGSSGGNTPTPTQSQAATTQSPASAGPPSYPGYQHSYSTPPSVSTFAAPQTYGQPHPAYPPPAASFAHSPPPQHPYGQVAQPFQQPYAQPPQPTFQQHPFPVPNAFSPLSYQMTPPLAHQAAHSQVPQNGFTGQVGAPRAYSSASPVSQFPAQPRTHSPAQNGLPAKVGNGTLPSAPGLPQRPAVSAPSVNAAQFQQMHQGQIRVQQNFAPAPAPQYVQHSDGYSPAAPQIGMPSSLSASMPGASSLDDLISSASRQADETLARAKTSTPNPSTPQPALAGKEDNTDAKTSKKDKDSKEKSTKATRLVYSDNETSPEEKMAALDRYKFTPV